MCGIFGFIGSEEIEVQVLIDPIYHRGPDADGIWKAQVDIQRTSSELWVQLGFKRLSIIDLNAHSNQPFHDESGQHHILFNGEIYNYLELKEELKADGVVFQTESDTEVLLKSYIHWGAECFQKFNGMWACMIYDESNQEVILSRDRFGIKPLYYFQSSTGTFFVSEIKQLFELPEFEKKMNNAVLRDFLESGVLDAGRETFFERVYSFPQSHYAKIRLADGLPGDLNFNSYWDLKEQELKDLSYEEAQDKFRDLFESSLKLHFRSDVPLGACLSGGLDSSSIVSYAGHMGKEITAFSVDNKDRNLSEMDYALDVVNSYKGLSSIKTFNEENDLELLDIIFDIQDEPISGLGVIAQWRVMKLAAENNITVLLDGQGGDEIFGGYRKFFFFYIKELISAKRFGLAIKELSSFLSSNEFGLFDREGVRRYLNRTNVAEFLKPNVRALPRSYNIGISGASGFKQKSYEDIFHFSYPQLLRYEDRNSMAFSLESRVPFLDYRLVEFVYSLPSSFKIRKGFTKAILRDSLKGILPNSVRLRKSKLGFATPEKRWMKETHHDYFQNYFKEMDNPYLENQRIYEAFAEGKDKLDYKSLLRLYLFDRWYQHHFS
jgi:asparagine synthase (glutamine-hydrolysing)